ncbi:hypothetical protein Ciccas_012086 [Cichlidogyrus casuarinus]|uniref:Uncharacterized protein n=1 Tax=Cichlidogyrus casuarinus TaxID=1844966 RepID=A0ABD2PR56_9PLAT
MIPPLSIMRSGSKEKNSRQSFPVNSLSQHSSQELEAGSGMVSPTTITVHSPETEPEELKRTLAEVNTAATKIGVSFSQSPNQSFHIQITNYDFLKPVFGFRFNNYQNN